VIQPIPPSSFPSPPQILSDDSAMPDIRPDGYLRKSLGQ
jgi:hypothetical protein